MRVLITTDTVGGVWTFTQEFAAGLLQYGCPVLMVSFGRVPDVAQRAQCTALEHDYPGRFRCVATDIPLEWMSNNQRAFENGARVLQEEIRRFQPDVIHSNQFCFGAVHSDVPRVVTAHSDVLSWAKACRSEAMPNTAWLRRYASMVQAGLSASDAVIAPTRWMLNALGESFTLPEYTSVVENGRSISADFFGPRVLRAVTAGRLWDEAKGIRLLETLTSPMPIVIAGDSRDERSPHADGMADVEFVGHLSEPEMIDLLQSSSVYLCLSKYEPFGLAPLEAALCGCAVVARDIPSLREVWGELALFFSNEKELGSILEKLSCDPLYLKNARERSYGRARRFTRERMVKQYLEVFRRVLEYSERAQNVA